uniref:E3 ubiquitin-protein ligase n=1 Tax=Malurus cyaneus samueli TaxID=2593467 RepID=A0A8C5U7G7_9PASS
MARQSSGAMLASGGLGFPPQNLARVVVWEWLNEHGRWRPYSAAVCHHIENVLKEDARGSVVLGQVDVQLAPYVIDLQSMHQFRQDTGTMRPVRRNFYDPSSAPGKGIVWEWENDNNSWTPYDMDICITIQNAYEKQHPWLDLSSLGFCYLIYFSSMSQMNRQTQRKRRLRRRMDLAYPLTMGSIPKSQSWPVGASTGTPACPQCLLVNSTRAASNAILASQRRKLYPGAVRQSSTFAGGTLWPAGTATPAVVAGGAAKGEGLRVAGAGFGPGQGVPSSAVPALPVKNLNGTGPVHPALAGKGDAILNVRRRGCLCPDRAPCKPILHPPPVSKSDIKPVPGVNGICRKTKKKQLKKIRPLPKDVVRPGVIPPNASPPAKDCNHLHERLVTSSGYEGVLSPKGIKPELVGKLGKCGHMYHLLCLLAMYNNGNKDGSLQCPTCKAIYGENRRARSPPGRWNSTSSPTPCRGPEHPNPGKKFTARGFPRHLHLPATEKGRKVLKLLIVIHHKTEFGSNLRATATPTPTTCDNVLAELLAQGVSEATLKTEAGLGGALRPPRPCPRRRRLRRWTASPARRVLLPVPWAYRSCHPPVFPVCVFCPSVRPVRSRLAPLSLAS